MNQRIGGPMMVVVGGPNGAGKTTFVNRYLKERAIPYLGADKIAAELCPANPESVAFEAGREFVRQIDDAIKSRKSFIVESTLSGKSLAKKIDRARQSGYSTEMHFVFVESSARSRMRVASRVRSGGHHVPDADVLRRFSRTIINFWALYRLLADDWYLYYNEGEAHVLAAKSVANDMSVVIPKLAKIFFDLAGVRDD